MKAYEWIDRVRSAKGLPSDYAVAKLLQIKANTISTYRSSGGPMDENIALKVAHLLEIDAAMVLADQAMERAKDSEARSAWESILKALAASVSLTPKSRVKKLAGAHAASAGSYHKDSNSPAKDLYIVSSRTRKIAASWLSILSPKPPRFA